MGLAPEEGICETRPVVTRRPKRAYHHGDLQRALADAAIELLAEVGPSFTLRQAAERVGVTHAAAYRHFDSRDALLAEVSRRGFVALGERLARSARGAAPPRERLERLLVAYLRFAWKHRAHYELMFGPRLNEGGRFVELERAIRASTRVLEEALGELLDSTDPVQCRDAGLAVWSFAHGYAVNVLARRIHVRSLRTAESYLVHLVRPLLDGLADGADAS